MPFVLVLRATGYPSASYQDDPPLLQKGGMVKWSSRNLGIDGIEVREVEDGVIFGRGCIDPPESWVSFALSVDTGRSVGQREHARWR